MSVREAIERVHTLSDGELLAGLSGALGVSRRWVAVVLAHLAEVEDRRLHLLAGYSSLFAYCTLRLAMSEDEAYRRIRVARLGRCFPAVLERLARGEISLSVAALLETRLTEANHTELLGAATHKTVGQAREVLAAWFPKPDVLPLIRKLPQRATATTSGATACNDDATPGACEPTRCLDAPIAASGASGASDAPMLSGFMACPYLAPAHELAAHADGSRVLRSTPEAAPAAARTSRPSSSVEPLAPGRYKVVFTASDALKRKLDLARDLSRHAVPSADLVSIIERALDLLIDKTLQRRFAKTHRSKAKAPDAPHLQTHLEPPVEPPVPDTANPPQTSGAVADDLAADLPTRTDTTTPAKPSRAPFASTQATAAPPQERAASTPATPHPKTPPPLAPHLEPAVEPPVPDAANPPQTSGAVADDLAADLPTRTDATTPAKPSRAPFASTQAAAAPPQEHAASTPATPHRSRHLPSATRRAVLERDGLRCTWVGPDGTRCGSQAWLEHDHITPRGHGGSDDPANIRIRCRPHNRLAAEQAYGRQTITRAIARRRAKRPPP